jgi:DNA-binding CsgD family transcriptional regulator
MRFLARRRRVVSLSTLAEALEADADLPAGSVVLTFDDGYLSNLTVAAPILQKYGLPATFLLPTGYVRRGQVQWADRLYGLFQARTTPRLRVSGKDMDLRDPRRERDAYREASTALLTAAPNRDPRLEWIYQRIAALDEVNRSLALLMLDGFSYRDMSQILGLSESNVGAKINRIKAALAAQLAKQEHDEL